MKKANHIVKQTFYNPDRHMSYVQLDMMHAVNLSGLTTWDRAIVSTEHSKLAKETTYNAHSCT